MQYDSLFVEACSDFPKLRAPLTLVFQPIEGGLDRAASAILVQLKTIPKTQRRAFLDRLAELLKTHQSKRYRASSTRGSGDKS